VTIVVLTFSGQLRMARSSANDVCLTAATVTSLPQPFKINGRFVIPWPGFKPPDAAGVVKYLAKSEDESNIPSTEVSGHLLQAFSCVLFIRD